LFCLADIPTVVVFLSSPVSLPGGQGSGAVVRSTFNGGRLCFGGGAPVIVDPSGVSCWCRRQVPSFSVGAGLLVAWRCRSSFIVQRLVDVAGYQLLVSPNKSGCELDVEVLVVPMRGLQVVGFRHFGAAPLSSAASSEFSLVSLLFVGGRALW
ncbi:unnamed protein product, partial [Brassica oleracea var. botrytis]